MSEDREQASGALAQHAFRAAGALQLLIEHMQTLGWRTDEYSREDLVKVAESLRGMSVRAAMSSGDTGIINMITGRAAVPVSPPSELENAAAAAMTKLTDPVDRAEVAAELHRYADQVAAGQAVTPALTSVQRADGGVLSVVPRVLHDVLCSWRVASGQDIGPEVLACAGCGLAYPKSS